MKLLKCEKTEKSMYELEIAVEKEVFEASIEKAYHKQVKNINVPGFRKGKAPRSIIEKMYGKGVFFEDAINDLIPTVYGDAIKEADIKNIVAQPEFDIVSVEGENGLVLSAKVYVKPEVEIADYVGLAVEKTVEPVTDEELDNEINTIRERNSREIEVTDRAAKLGDTTVIDYEGFVDGKAFDGGKGESFSLKLGSGQFIPGFEDQVAGHNTGESFDVNVEFPKEYHAAELAGKAATFKVTLHKITMVELPALDDDFAKDVSEFDTFDEYKADLKAKIEKRHDQKAESAMEEKIMDALIEKMKADIPAPMFEAETENFIRDYDNNLRMNGLDLNTYFKYTGLTLEKLREQFRPQAEKQVKARLALEKIAELEKIEATEEDINGEYERIANAYGVTVEQVKESIESAAIAEDMKVKKAVEFVKEKANISAKAPKAKKTTTKKAAAEGETADEKAEKPAAKKKCAPKKTAEGEATADAEKPAAKKTTAKKTTAKKEAPKSEN